MTGAQTEVTNGPSDSLVGLLIVPAPVPTLSISGNCPGTLSVEVSNATPGGAVALASGTFEGPFTVPFGRCAGTQIGLADPVLITVLNADATGTLSVSRTVGAGPCGLLVQFLDVATCTPTAVATVP